MSVHNHAFMTGPTVDKLIAYPKLVCGILLGQWLLEKIQHGLFVITHQEDSFDVGPRRRLDQQIDSFTRVFATFDGGSHEDNLRGDLIGLRIIDDAVEQARQQVMPTMHVTDGIDYTIGTDRSRE